jgi:hypothetical protein
MTSSGMEPAAVRLLAYCLNQLHYGVPLIIYCRIQTLFKHTDVICVYVCNVYVVHTYLLPFNGYVWLHSYAESLKGFLIKYSIGK